MSTRSQSGADRPHVESSTGLPPVESSAGVSPVESSAGVQLVHRMPEAHAAARGACLWLLPADLNGWWPVWESQPSALAEALSTSRACILVALPDSGEEQLIHQRAREYVLSTFDPRLHEKLSAFLSRALLGAAFSLVALVGVGMLSGWAEVLDVLLLLFGIALLIYSILRYGFPAARLQQLRVDALQAFGRADLVPSPLAGRLAKALSLRRTLAPQERGKSPDDELLDTKAYQKLINEGVTTRAELCALGRSVAEALRLDSPQEDRRKFGDLAREAGLDMESAMFYRDLAAAAREIGLGSE